MEIDITEFVMNENAFDFSGSIAERGKNAAKETWSNAIDKAKGSALLTTPKEMKAFRDHMKGFGAWNDEEIAAWSNDECNALFIQLISGDMRECGMEGDMSEFDWSAYESDDNLPHSISRGDNETIYYYLGE